MLDGVSAVPSSSQSLAQAVVDERQHALARADPAHGSRARTCSASQPRGAAPGASAVRRRLCGARRECPFRFSGRAHSSTSLRAGRASPWRWLPPAGRSPCAGAPAPAQACCRCSSRPSGRTRWDSPYCHFTADGSRSTSFSLISTHFLQILQALRCRHMEFQTVRSCARAHTGPRRGSDAWRRSLRGSRAPSWYSARASSLLAANQLRRARARRQRRQRPAAARRR